MEVAFVIFLIGNKNFIKNLTKGVSRKAKHKPERLRQMHRANRSSHYNQPKLGLLNLGCGESWNWDVYIYNCNNIYAMHV